MRKRQRGSGAIEVILIVVIVGLIAGVGFYLFHKNQTKDQSATSHEKTQTSATEQAMTASSASKAVSDFYNKYTKLDPPGNPSTEEAFLKQYGTENLLTYFKNNQNGVDPIVCAQAIPESIKIASSTVHQGTATVVADEIFGTDKVSVTATVIDQNTLKVDTLKCSVALPSHTSEGP